MLVCDLYDVSYGEPAFLTVGQADAFTTAWERRGGGGGKGEGGEQTREDWRFLYRSCKKVKKEINKLLRWRVED